MRPSAPLEALAARIRQLAQDVDAERLRTGRDLTSTPAGEAAEAFLGTPENLNRFHMVKYGNTLGEELWRLSLLPDAAPTYDTFQAPALDEGDDRLPFDTWNSPAAPENI